MTASTHTGYSQLGVTNDDVIYSKMFISRGAYRDPIKSRVASSSKLSLAVRFTDFTPTQKRCNYDTIDQIRFPK